MANIRENSKSNNKLKGGIGEEIACKYLINKGFCIVGRNYRKIWGEIDIIVTKDKIIHFIEVKSVTYQSVDYFNYVSHRPEDNVDGFKIRQIRRMVQTYLSEYNIGLDMEFKFHVLCVYLNLATKLAKVKMIENIIL